MPGELPSVDPELEPTQSALPPEVPPTSAEREATLRDFNPAEFFQYADHAVAVDVAQFGHAIPDTIRAMFDMANTVKSDQRQRYLDVMAAYLMGSGNVLSVDKENMLSHYLGLIGQGE